MSLDSVRLALVIVTCKGQKILPLRKLILATRFLISQKTLPLHYSIVVFITASIWRMSPFEHGRQALPTESQVDWKTSSWKACIHCMLYMAGNITSRDWKRSISS